MTAPVATATGTLAATPLSSLLVYLLDRRLDGTLVLEAPGGGKSALSFERGAPRKAKTAEPVAYLGRVLFEQGAIDEATETRTLSVVAKEQRLHGAVLLAEGAVDAVTLGRGLLEQLARQLEWMCALPLETVYGFYEGADFLARWGAGEPAPARPLALFWRVFRGAAPDAHLAALRARLAGQELRLHPEAQVARFGFNAKEQSVLDVLRAKPWRFEALRASGLDEPEAIDRVLCALLATRHLDLGVSGALPVGVTGPSPSPPPPRRTPAIPARVTPATPPVEPASRPPAAEPDDDPAVLAFKREVREAAERAGKQNYYELLGVEPEASTSIIQAAFFRLAKRFHPDRAGPECADVHDELTRYFARVSEAHQMLSDVERRAEYDRFLAAGGLGSADEQEAVTRVLRAATAFQKAEVLLKKNDLAGAAREAKAAVEGDPEQADYIALDAWVRSQAAEHREDSLAGLIARLEHALAREPNNLRAHWYRGQLLKRAGKEKAALKDFRWIVENHPRHLDAAREVRLYEMRLAAAATDKSDKKDKGRDTGNILNKLFKR
ncbi:MAG: J domain-containing protein [Sorangiineae bacterium]|nr:J domain-containing protein [Polyangiaceae bacterium]MEB2324881.1 J domain-containing protein [Sorangiineae bacterium]